MSLLVVAGEASGDRAAAAVVARLGRVEAFGMGGGAMQREGVELVADLRKVTAMGVEGVARRAYGVASAYARVRAAILRRRPAAALLVNYTEFNMRLAEVLWSAGTRVLWYGAPQIWAWRAHRAAPLRKHLDRMAVMFPFEEALWRDLGVDAHYVGHPALEDRFEEDHRATARAMLDLTPFCDAVAILPGSRPHEVRRLLEPLLEGYETVQHDRASVDARLLLASSLDDKTRLWARGVAAAHGLDVVDIDPRGGIAPLLRAFDAALCASGTASLECVLSNVIPVVCYRVGWATEVGARALLKTPRIALPNILLERDAFPELLQRRVAPAVIAKELERVLDHKAAFLAEAQAVERVLGEKTTPSLDVARMLEPWLWAARAAS